MSAQNDPWNDPRIKADMEANRGVAAAAADASAGQRVSAALLAETAPSRGDRPAQDAAEGLPQTAGAEQGLPDPSEGMADSGRPARGGSAESGLNDPWNDPRIKADMAANRGVAAAAAAASAGQRVSAAPLAETAPRRGAMAFG